MSRSSIYILNREKIQILDAREYVPPCEITVSNNGHLTTSLISSIDIFPSSDNKYTSIIQDLKFPNLIFDVESIFLCFRTIGTCKNGRKTPFRSLQRVDTPEIVVKFDQKSFLHRHFIF